MVFMMYNEIMEANVKQNMVESNNNLNTYQICVSDNNKKGINSSKKSLTPYQKYKNSRNQNGKKYFEFYDDIKVYTHRIYDW